jgi:hypothetical protein
VVVPFNCPFNARCCLKGDLSNYDSKGWPA